MKPTEEWALKTVELCGRIAVLAELHKWGDIQDLLNLYALDAYKAGMGEAVEILRQNLIKSDCSSCNRWIELNKIEILTARDNKTSL